MSGQPVAVVLAGGDGKRMEGGAKPLLPVLGRPMLSHVLERLESRVSETVLSIKRDAIAYEAFGLPCVRDIPVPAHSPLVGIASAMNWYVQRGLREGQLLVVPADVPFFPVELIDSLQRGMRETAASCACVEVAGRLQPLFSLWSLTLASPLLREVSCGNLGVAYVLEKYRAIRVDIVPGNAADFVNVNTAQELAALQQDAR